MSTEYNNFIKFVVSTCCKFGSLSMLCYGHVPCSTLSESDRRGASYFTLIITAILILKYIIAQGCKKEGGQSDVCGLCISLL